MNFLERLAGKPQFVMTRRSDEPDDHAIAASGFESLRIRFLEVWSQKGADAPVPDWLASADSLRNHLQEILGDFLAVDGDEDIDRAEAAAGAETGLAFGGPIEGVFESGASLAEILPPDLPFEPVSVNLPFVVG